MLNTIKKEPKNKNLLLKFFSETTDFTNCLRFAIQHCDMEIVEKLISVTTDFKFCLAEVIRHRSYEKDLFLKILEKTGNTDYIFREALKSIPYDTWILDKLLDKSHLPTICLYDAIEITPWHEDLHEKLLKRCIAYKKDLSPCLEKALRVMPHNDSFIHKLFSASTDYGGCLLAVIETKNIPLLKKIYDVTKDFEGCLLAAIIHLPESKDLIDALFEKTKDFSGCLLAAIPTKRRLLVRALYPKTTDFSGCTASALLYMPNDREFLKMLFSKGSDGFSYNQFFFVDNLECFVCLCTFDTPEDEFRMFCGHRIHKGCNAGMVNCRLH